MVSMWRPCTKRFQFELVISAGVYYHSCVLPDIRTATSFVNWAEPNESRAVLASLADTAFGEDLVHHVDQEGITQVSDLLGNC